MRAALILLVALACFTWVQSSVGAAPRFVRNIDTGETGWFASPALVDLTGDRRLEIVAPFYRLRNQRTNGNGVGIAAAPSIADLDRDGRLEIVVTTFDHGIDVYRVPRSNAKRLPWPTARGNLLRDGTP